MRIDDSNSLQYGQLNQLKRLQSKAEQGSAKGTAASGSSAGEGAQASGGSSRADRIEQLKQAYSQGNSVDIGKLADKLMQTGVFFDEKA